MNVSVVVPVYNGAASLPMLVKELGDVLPQVTEKYELVLVNDGSQDQSWKVISELVHSHSWVCGVDLMRNYGQENATLCGIREARYEITVVMDDDLQNQPSEIPKLLAKLNEGYDVVYGVPRKRRHPWWKRLSSIFVKRTIAYVMGMSAVRDITAFKAFRTDLRRAFDMCHGPYVLVDAMLSWSTANFASVTVDELPRTVGKSNYNLFKLIKVSLLVLTSYTTVPLRLASILGFLFTLFGVGILTYVLTIYFSQGSVEGFPFLASTVAIFSGVQLFALGIIGEYLGRIFERTGGRPTYTIGQRIKK